MKQLKELALLIIGLVVFGILSSGLDAVLNGIFNSIVMDVLGYIFIAILVSITVIGTVQSIKSKKSLPTQ